MLRKSNHTFRVKLQYLFFYGKVVTYHFYAHLFHTVKALVFQKGFTSDPPTKNVTRGSKIESYSVFLSHIDTLKPCNLCLRVGTV